MDAIIQAIIALVLMYGAVVFVLWLLQVIAKWRIFTKAGIAGWKSIIPVYSDYLLMKLSWSGVAYWLLALMTVMATMLTGNGADAGNGMLVAMGDVCLIVAMVMLVLQQLKLAKRFGHGVLFGLGLIFLNPVFMLILGFGNDRYLGNPEAGIPAQSV